MISGRLWVTVCLWLFAVFAVGQVVDVGEGVADGRFKARWSKAVEHLGYPGALTQAGEVKVLAEVSGGYVRLTLAGFQGTDGKELAAVLDEWNGDGVAAEYGVDDAVPSAESWAKSGRLWASSATSTADLGALQSLLVEAGFEPYLALYVPVKADVLGEFEVAFEGRNWSLLKVEEMWPVVTLTTRLERYDVLTAGSYVYVPFLVLMGSGLGVWLYCRRSSIELPRRRFVFTNYVFLGVMLFLPLSFVTQYGGYKTGAFQRVADVWAGDSFANLSSYVFLVSCLVGMAPFGIWVAVIDRKYIKERDESGRVVAEPEVTKETIGGREEAGLPRILIRALALPLAMILYWVLPQRYKVYGLLAGAIVWLAALDYREVVKGLKRDQIDPDLANQQDDDVVRPVIRVAQLMGARLKLVQVARGGKPGSQTGAVYSSGEVTVGADLVKVADEEMLDAAVAFAIEASRRRNHLILLFFGIFWGGSTTLGVLIAVFRILDYGPGFFLLITALVILVPTVVLLMSQATQYREPGRVAIWKRVISTLRTVRGARRYAVILADSEWPYMALKPSNWDEVALVERAARELGYDPRDPGE